MKFKKYVFMSDFYSLSIYINWFLYVASGGNLNIVLCFVVGKLIFPVDILSCPSG